VNGAFVAQGVSETLGFTQVHESLRRRSNGSG